MKFLHTADVHLGYQQYGSKERFNDFSKAFLHIVEQALEEDVDFLLLAGDLFHKRTVDPLAMRIAIEGLRMLREAEIPVLAVEGNHERAYYRDQYSWLDLLEGLGYLYLLNPRFGDGEASLDSYDDAGGAYVDLGSGNADLSVRVYGLKYYGASTGRVFDLFADAIAEQDADVDVTILMAHAGVEGQLPHYSGTLTYDALAPLREHVDYLALGHIHKPYALDSWIYNPGSPETCGMDEVAWPNRGVYLVELEPGHNPGHHAELIPTPRRPFHRLRLEVDGFTDPNSLYDAVRALIEHEGDAIRRNPAPVVELTLGGVLPFNRFDLDLDYVEDLLEEAWSPLITRVHNRATPAAFEMDIDTEAARPELERSIVQELLERDARFRPDAEAWTRVALDVKRMMLEDSPPEAVIDALREAKEGLRMTYDE
jgi:DNA repair exonuclease SbcCD nuclease subunit